ncbi:Protein STRL-1 b [Aphelenchoides avenae]|nr:Protein STRL-1 b [Aphelenchus avenae]
MTSVTLHGVTDTLAPEHEKYADVLKSAEAAFNEAYAIFTTPEYKTKEGWKKEAEEGGATVHSKVFKFGKLFALSAELPLSVEEVYEDNWNGLEKISEWNANIDFARHVAKLSEHCNIVHYGNAPVLVVSGRDYVASRLHRKVDGTHYIVAHSVKLPEVPETKERVRATINMGGGRFRPHPTKDDVTLIDFALSIDFKGFIPGRVVEAVMGKLLLKEYEENRKHCEQIKNSRKN